MRKFALRFAVFLTCGALLIVLFYLEEDWRGARDWAECQKQLAAKGEILDLRLLAPPGKPEDDLSKVPIFEEMNKYAAMPTDSKAPLPQLMRVSEDFGTYSSKRPKMGDYLTGKSIDLSEWQAFYHSVPEAKLGAREIAPAEDVLLALSQFSPELNEIETALRNPNAFWPINYDRPFETPLASETRLLHVAGVLALRATANLNENRAGLAFEDYVFSFDLNRGLFHGAPIIFYLIGIADRKIDDRILWEGIRRHAWNAAQLHEIAVKLSDINLLAEAKSALRVERAEGLQTFASVQSPDEKTKEFMRAALGSGFDVPPNLLYARPSGWWGQDRRQYALQNQIRIEAIHLQDGVFDKLREPPQPNPSAETWQMIYTPLSFIATRGLGRIGAWIAEAEEHRRLAMLACFLEEYYLTHKEYPVGLDSLTNLPPHLNEEVLTGRPLHYQRKGAGYSLYSTGWDETDHGGTPRTSDPSNEDHYDWVWPSP